VADPRPAPYPADTRAKGWRSGMGEFLDAARVAPEKAVFRPALPMFLLPGWNGTNMGQMTYLAQLRHPKWQRKRLEVLQRDGWMCQRCCAEDKTLNVHHKRYIKGALAWEYSGDDLTSLCEDCHELTHAEENDFKAEASRLSARYGDIKELMLGFYSAADFVELHEWFHTKATPLEVAGFVASKVQILSRADAALVYELAHELFMADVRGALGKGNA